MFHVKHYMYYIVHSLTAEGGGTPPITTNVVASRRAGGRSPRKNKRKI